MKVKSDNCTACYACINICPEKALKYNGQTGNISVETEKCVHCDLCETVCADEPVNGENTFAQQLIGAYRRNRKIRQASSSGGVFWGLLESFFEESDKKCVAWGAAWNESCEVIHDCAYSLSESNKFLKSKYVHTVFTAYHQTILEQLNNGYRVLFSGTPCQIDSVKHYLALKYKSNPNIVYVDFICHGTPNDATFQKWKRDYEAKKHSRVCSVSFREKIHDNSRCLKINFDNGKTVIEDSTENRYLRGFHNSLFYRPSCYQCKYASSKRVSDVTLGDLWGAEEIDDQFDTSKGVSYVSLNTQTGLNIWNDIRSEYVTFPITNEFAMKHNGQLSSPARMNKTVQFTERFLNEPFDELVDSLIPASSVHRGIIAKTVSRLFSAKTKRFIKRTFHINN